MKRFEYENKILKWKPWVHIVLGIYTCFLWFIVLLIIYFDYNNSNKESAKKAINSNTENYDNKKEPIISVHFKVAGVTFENRQKIIKQIVNENKNTIFHKPYYGMTNKEIIDNGNEIYEINNLSVNSLRLEPTTFKNEDAIEVYISDNEEKEYMVGYVPEHKIKEVQKFLIMYNEHPNYQLKSDAYFTGGKYKVGEFNDCSKEVIKTYKNNYGINIKLELYEQK